MNVQFEPRAPSSSHLWSSLSPKNPPQSSPFFSASSPLSSEQDLVYSLLNCESSVQHLASNPLSEVDMHSVTSSTLSQVYPYASPLSPKSSLNPSLQRSRMMDSSSSVQLKRSEGAQIKIPVAKRSKLYDSEEFEGFAVSFRHPPDEASIFDKSTKIKLKKNKTREDLSLKTIEETLEEHFRAEDEEIRQLQETTSLQFKGPQRLVPNPNNLTTLTPQMKLPSPTVNNISAMRPPPPTTTSFLGPSTATRSQPSFLAPQTQPPVLQATNRDTSTMIQLSPSSPIRQQPVIPAINVISPTPAKSQPANQSFGSPTRMETSPVKTNISSPTSPISPMVSSPFQTPATTFSVPALINKSYYNYQPTTSTASSPYFSPQQPSFYSTPYPQQLQGQQTPIFQTQRSSKNFLNKSVDFLNSFLSEDE